MYNFNYEYMTFLYVVHVYMFCNAVLYYIALPARLLFAIKIIIIISNIQCRTGTDRQLYIIITAITNKTQHIIFSGSLVRLLFNFYNINCPLWYF